MEELQKENEQLRKEIASLKQRVRCMLPSDGVKDTGCSRCEEKLFNQPHNLTKHQVERYSRQLLLPSFGIDAQEKLCNTSILIVGCGGLGSPAALYLAAMGVGTLGLVDRDAVEASNLHRQIMHTEAKVGVHKALSARSACHDINSSINIRVHTEGFTAGNAVEIVREYDVVIDCSDNPATRYLISDACACTGRPLVSGAAVGTDGQLTVYCLGEDAPCYRCLFPESPAPENCSRCSDAGVLGVVPGVIGTLQALEAVKVVCGIGDPLVRRLLVFDGLAARFMVVKLRAKRPECVACGAAPSITADNLSGYDYEAFTGQPAGDGPPPPAMLLEVQERVTVQQLQDKLSSTSTSTSSLVLLDVRPAHQYGIMSLPGAVNFPFAQFEKQMDEVTQLCRASSSRHTQDTGEIAVASNTEEAASNGMGGPGQDTENHAPEVLVICRRGNDSQRAVVRLRQAGITWAKDVVGGYSAWAAEVDPTMPTL